MDSAEGWGEVGARIREARSASGLSQAAVARELGVDRSAVVRIEAGDRQVSALELFRLSDLLRVDVAYFVTRPVEAVVSRRQALAEEPGEIERLRFRLDVALQTHARDAEWLVGQGFLLPSTVELPTPVDLGVGVDGRDRARETAREVRRALGLRGPLPGLADVCGRAGLHLLVMADLQAGATQTLRPGVGVAVVGAEDDPGRRRFTAAHELGHFVLQDDYTADLVSSSRSEREARIDVFASEFLLPQAELAEAWSVAIAAPRVLLIQIAGRYRVSWSTAVRSAQDVGVVSKAEADRLRADTPLKSEFIECLGDEPQPDLRAGSTGREWKQAVLSAFRARTLTRGRVVELLHGSLTEDDLPEVGEGLP